MQPCQPLMVTKNSVLVASIQILSKLDSHTTRFENTRSAVRNNTNIVMHTYHTCITSTNSYTSNFQMTQIWYETVTGSNQLCVPATLHVAYKMFR